MKRVLLIAFVFFWAVSVMAVTTSHKAMKFSASAAMIKKEKYFSADGKFKIMFPGNPVRTEEKVPTDVGDITMVMFMFEKSQTEAFMVAYSDYPVEMMQGLDPYQLLDGSKNGVLSNFGATELNLKKFRIKSFPAITFEGKGTSYCTSYLLVLRNNRLYQAGILKAGSLPSKKDVKSFIGSFELTD
ncbi:MAG: hypothetical protein N2167_04220 [Flavobacteriales bacterium]|nr:hypothetical protein [Flavobacteriales bacterium]